MGFPPLPAPTGNRFTTPTPDNNASPIWIVAVLSICYSLLTYFVRLGIKVRNWDWDDLTLGVGYVFATVQWSLIFTALSHGLGKNEVLVSNAEEWVTMAKMVHTSRIFLVLVLSFSKCSVLLILRQLFTADVTKVWTTSNICIAFILAYGVGSSIALSAGCEANHFVLPRDEAHCGNDVLRLQLVIAFDVLAELLVIILPVFFLWQLQMTFTRKLLVLIAFLSRLPNVFLSLAYLFAYATYIHSSRRGTNITSTFVWQEILLGYSLISATIPVLKGFVSKFNTGGLGDVGVGDLTSHSRSGGADRSASRSGAGTAYQMAGVTSGKNDNGSRNREESERSVYRDEDGDEDENEDDDIKIRPDNVRYTVSAYKDDVSVEDVSTRSQDGSEKMIIRRHVGWWIQRS